MPKRAHRVASAITADSHPFTLTIFTDGQIGDGRHTPVVKTRHFDRLSDVAVALFNETGCHSPRSWKVNRFATSVNEDGRSFTRRHAETETVRITEHGDRVCVERVSFTHFEVTDASGKRVRIAHLLELGEQLDAERNAYRRRWRWRAVYCGFGPVPGIRKWRGGRSYMRRIHTTAERRLNGLVLFEEGEVACRAARNTHNLPHSWDDIMRHRENGWKSQHKGAKSWDRVRAHGAPRNKRDESAGEC
jgi:hypothetical protein